MVKIKSKKLRPYIQINSQLRSLNYCLSHKEYQEDGDWLAECPELQLIVAGKTKLKAYDSLIELIATTLVVAIETGTIGEHLKALGFGEVELPVPTMNIYSIRQPIAQDTIPLISSGSSITLPPLNQYLVDVSS